MSSFASAMPAAFPKCSRILFLPWFHWLNGPDESNPGFTPRGAIGNRRIRSRCACDSILMTSAPRYARCIVQYGPAHTQEKSATRRPSRGKRVLGARGWVLGVGCWELTTDDSQLLHCVRLAVALVCVSATKGRATGTAHQNA